MKKRNPDSRREDTLYRDTLYRDPVGEIAQFKFDQSVVDVFADMIERSVPGYSTIIHMIGTLAERYAREHSNCYDLGCSLGAATFAMAQAIQVENCSIIGVDNSQAMINQCQQVLAQHPGNVPVSLVHSDLQELEIVKASVVVLNFTLQFISPEQREALIANIYKGMLPGGVLILSEKVIFADEHHNQLMIALHHDFKKANGYSDLEISQKRSALEQVLVPDTLETHKNRLKKIGFSGCELWFQCFNFASLIAIK